MSLADQSQQWFPTSIQVTVHQARNLRVKGKNGTNDAYAIIQVAKDKFSTSVAEKCVAPVWKEEASFDLPLFHPGNAERCTLYIIVMHRAQVGLDKFLGQAVINLLVLYDNKSRQKTDWFKLVDKTGKEDKVRGEVLLDIQFMRNNMSASMFDLSMQDKPRSRLSKLKDKVRGKKKDGFSDSASAIVPSVGQVLTDSEGEADAQSVSQFPEVKKKSKIKNLFAPKSNLQRNISQSMSTLGTLPEKNSSLSGSRSSGLNIDSPEVKKKFKFLGHKRTGSSDSKVSQGPFSLLGRSKQSNNELNNLCINGSHVYTEEEEHKNGSTLSLNSSGQGSVEDVRKQVSDVSADSFMSAPVASYKNESVDRAVLEQQRHQEEEERRQAEAKRLEEEQKYRAEAKRLQEEEERRYQEEQQRKRLFLEDEARRKKQREEEEDRRKQEEERRMQEAAENQRLEEERRRAEEQKRQEEASMSDRLSSLFGMIRKKEEKKEEVSQHPKEELHTAAPRSDSRDPDQPISPHSTNPFEDIPLGSVPPPDHQKSSHNPQTPSATVFLNRSAKVSAVKPRLPQSLDSEPADCQSSDSTLSSVPSESPDTFFRLHSSLAPTNISRSPFGSPSGSIENLSSVGSSPTMADKKKKAPLRLPDYESLFPQKRHGVQGHAQWDNIVAEVNRKRRDPPPELLGPEMSVDGLEDHELSPRSSISHESSAVRHYQTHQETKPMSSKKVTGPAPPKPPHSGLVADSSQSQSPSHQSHKKPNSFVVPGPANTITSSISGLSTDRMSKVLQPSPAVTHAPGPTNQMETTPPNDQRKAPVNTEAPPTAKPRQRASTKEPTQLESAVTPNKNMNGNIQTSSSSLSSMDKKGGQAKENLVEFDSFPNSELLSTGSWTQLKQNQDVDDIFTSNLPKEQKPKEGTPSNDLDKIFSQQKPSDPFASFISSNSDKPSEYRNKDDNLKQTSPVFQRRNSRPKKLLPSVTHLHNKSSMSGHESAYKEEVTVTTARDVLNESVTVQPQADVKTQSSLFGGEDPFGAQPFNMPSALSSSEPLPVVLEEPASQAGGLSGGKSLLRAWVSPSEVQTVSAQNSSGGGLRRPHPVKPLSSLESQHTTSIPAVKGRKSRDTTPGKIKVADTVESGPFTQLTQEELITLVVKQQTDLSRKDAKIVELEEYIDNLLVRVIEEKPTILQALNSAKPV